MLLLRKKKDRETVNSVCALILKIEFCSSLLSLVIWSYLIFQINKAIKIMQTFVVLLEVVETEIKATGKC